MVFTTTADAVDREAEWLSVSNDALPSLLVAHGGRWDLVNPYWRRTPPQRQKIVWVNRAKFHVRRYAHVRKLVTYHFELELWWPLSAPTGNAESAQREFDLAIDDVVKRVSGLGYTSTTVADKTHGGRFLSVGETNFDGDSIDVDTPPSTQTLPGGIGFQATVRYYADDYEFNN